MNNTTNESRLVTWRLHVILGTALLAQASCWLWATPGPFLRGQTQSIETAITNACVAFGFLFIYPLIVGKILGMSFADLGLQIGQWRRGAIVTLIALPIVTVLLYFGCNHPEIKAAYPWTGEWLAQSTTNMVLWFSVYLLYYVGFEFFFRGFLLNGLEAELGFAAAMWIQVLMSVSIHFGKPTPEILGAIPAGFLFGWVAYRTKSIIYVVLIHWVIGMLNDWYAMQ